MSVTAATLHNFAPQVHGAYPSAGLVADASGSFYGTTVQGGQYGQGAVFQLAKNGSGVWVEKVLHSFAGGADGAYPTSSLVLDRAGNLYGTTNNGGLTTCSYEYAGCGVVFELIRGTHGWSEVILHTFGSAGDGAVPIAGLGFDSSGNLYGTTLLGGQSSSGTVFKLTPGTNAWREMVIYSFTGGSDGGTPQDGVVFDKYDNIFGTTRSGGDTNCGDLSPFGCGTVFELTPQTSGTYLFNVVHTFPGSNLGWCGPTGKVVLDAAGNIYGNDSCAGTYQLQRTQNTWAENDVYVTPFGNTGDLSIDKANNIYGVTVGEDGDGTVFQLTLGQSGNDTVAQLYTFPVIANPNGGLVLDAAGNLFGTAQEPFLYASAGTVFELTPKSGGTWMQSTLYRFATTDGINPEGTLVADSTGNLYGTTLQGGDSSYSYYGLLRYGNGSVFKMTKSGKGWTSSILYNFSEVGGDGFGPSAGLIFDAEGNIYGTTQFGGAHGGGTVFRLTPQANGTWTKTTLYSFLGGFGGYQPVAGLVMDADGNLYGTTEYGGPDGTGILFRLAPRTEGSWKFSLLHAFGGALDGAYPAGTLVLDTSGNLYGTAPWGGANNAGIVFQLSPAAEDAWTENVLYSFAGGVAAETPTAGLTFDSSGNLYGTAGGGPTGNGIVFKLSPTSGGTWTVAVIYAFAGGPADGSWPASAVVFDEAGNLYGTTQYGGPSNVACYTSCGIVFKLTPSTSGQWTETILHLFSGFPIDGGWPLGGVTINTSGGLFGAASLGGNYQGGPFHNGLPGTGDGTVYEITP